MLNIHKMVNFSPKFSKIKQKKEAAVKEPHITVEVVNNDVNQRLTEIEFNICRDAYTHARYPIIFNCGHSVCFQCSKQIVLRRNKLIFSVKMRNFNTENQYGYPLFRPITQWSTGWL
jgi:hypothetical protein